ncbi:MAG TPA: tyrosine recombinase XerC [Caldithrix abyssi]|uniref:Tyrosine recombinase XerC n=1 Tax=Caldithrix abyssi TaxID=187145 RepID=A0A7V1PUF8_CALAY|nr:tyrosine recombinase XerC [Caldithrix abyssi]
MDISSQKFFRYLELEKRYSRHTIENYRIDLNQFSKFLTHLNDGYDISWERVTLRDIRAFLMELHESGLGKRSIARKVATLKSFFRYLEISGVVTQSIAASVKMPKFEKKLPEFLTAEEVSEILLTVKGQSFEAVRDRAILELFYACGLRLSELIGLRMEHLILREKALRVHGKGNKERIVPLGDMALNALKEYINRRPAVALPGTRELFVLSSGKKMYPMAVQRLVKKYIQQVVRNTKAHPHILRHSYATHLLNNGANIRVVKDLLGHENLSTTQVYTHISIEHLQNVYKNAHKRATQKKS